MRPPRASPLVVLLNGVPGVGKSTLARAWAQERPGTWVLDVDALRTLVSGWRDDFAATGAVVRPVALAALTAAARDGRDVVVPQLLADPAERDRFGAAAEAGGARVVEVVVRADDARARLAGRGDDAPWSAAVRELVAAGGEEGLARYARSLAERCAEPGVLTLDTTGLDVAAAVAALTLLLSRSAPREPGPGAAAR